MLMLMSHVAESRTTHRSEPRRGSDLYKKISYVFSGKKKSSKSTERLTTLEYHREQLSQTQAGDGKA